MTYIDNIGKHAYLIYEGKIKKDQVYKARVTHTLNTGSDRHGRLLDPEIEYLLRGNSMMWLKARDIWFSKEELINSLP